MNNTVKVEHIIDEITKLDTATKMQLITQIQHLIGNIEPKKKYQLTDLRGLGKTLWGGINVDSYLQNERQ